MNYLSICLFENKKKKRILSLDSLYSKLLTTNEKNEKNECRSHYQEKVVLQL